MNVPLHGIRVIDLTNIVASPLGSYQLALMGAEVIKIETPGTGDLSRKRGADPAQARKGMGVSYLALNAGKKSITLNLKHEEAKNIFRKPRVTNCCSLGVRGGCFSASLASSPCG